MGRRVAWSVHRGEIRYASVAPIDASKRFSLARFGHIDRRLFAADG
jgi:hypothetical protein